MERSGQQKNKASRIMFNFPWPKTLAFTTLLKNIKGVGPKTNECFLSYGLETSLDILKILPKAYQDKRYISKIASLQPNETALIKAKIVKVNYNPRALKKFVNIVVEDETDTLNLYWFRVYPALLEQLKKDTTLFFYAKVTLYQDKISMAHPEILSFFQAEIKPLYKTLNKIKPANFHKIMAEALSLLATSGNLFSSKILEKYNLEDPIQSLKTIHAPPANCQGSIPLPLHTKARKNLAFFELVFWRLAVFKKNKNIYIERKNINAGLKILNKYFSYLPFTITAEQSEVIDEIIQKLSANKIMNRLLQGEVGSGKTVVLGASLVFSLATLKGQVALMAPTEVLARQHFCFFQEIFKKLKFKTALLVGSLSETEKRRIKEDLKKGEINFIIGTQSLLRAEFKNLTLTVIDEQHKFGVHQRLSLSSNKIDLLTVSATPIPRSLALTLYNDLEISNLKEIRGQLKKTETILYNFKQKKTALQNFVKIIENGGQGFLVNPNIGEDISLLEAENDINLPSLKDLKSDLKKYLKKDIKLAILHGKLSAKEKIEIVEKFRNEEIKVLISTSIIEVGFDIPTANCILINGAEYFGLAQLHQLKGRVGRKGQKSYCFLLATGNLTENGETRLKALTENYSGQQLADLDLKLRGPGEHLGLKQSGWPAFEFAKFPEDFYLIKEANALAQKLLKFEFGGKNKS